MKLKIHCSLLLFLIASFLIDSIQTKGAGPGGPATATSTDATYKCCDNTPSTDCTCSGTVGTCTCKTAPKTRQGWLCTNNANGDSVSMFHIKI